MVDHQVVGDAEGPRGERAFPFFVFANVLPDSQKGLLGQILGDPFLDTIVNVTVDRPNQGIVDGGKRLRVTRLGLFHPQAEIGDIFGHEKIN